MTMPSQQLARARTRWEASRKRVRDEYDSLRAHYLMGALDAVVTARLAPSRSQSPDTPAIRRGPRGYRRAQQLANLVATLLPRGFDAAHRRLIKTTQMPFAGGTVSLLSFGSGATVFLVEHMSAQGASDARVVKIDRRSLGRRPETLFELARKRRTTYITVSEWYAGCSLLLPTHFMILHGPLLSCRAVACVQPFVAGPHIDVFRDLSERDLVGLLRAHPRVRAQFRALTERTLRAVEQRGWCLDLLGPNNVTITGEGELLRLTLLEHGIHYLNQLHHAAPAGLSEIRSRLAYLMRVDQQA
jgi:hypothetical protein